VGKIDVRQSRKRRAERVIPGAMYIEQSFELDPGEIASARHLVRRAAADTAVLRDLVLIVSELATNAVRHAGTAFRVSLAVNSFVRVEVSDESDQMPAKAVGGIPNHGLDIVDMLATKWGVESNPVGKTIWVELEEQ
jgi:two-component sensor histidine kinase